MYEDLNIEDIQNDRWPNIKYICSIVNSVKKATIETVVCVEMDVGSNIGGVELPKKVKRYYTPDGYVIGDVPLYEK